MPNRWYYSITFGLIAVLLTLSIVLTDMSILFDLIGMVCCTFYIFFFPAFAWLISANKASSLKYA